MKLINKLFYGANCGGGDPLAFGSPAYPISFNVHEYSKKYLEIAKIQFLSLEGIARDALTALENDHKDLVAVTRIIDEGIERLGFFINPSVCTFEAYCANRRYILYESQFKKIKDEHKSMVAAIATIDTILNDLVTARYIINEKKDRWAAVGRERWTDVDQVLRTITERLYLDDRADPVTPRAPVVEYFLREIGEIE